MFDSFTIQNQRRDLGYFLAGLLLLCSSLRAADVSPAEMSQQIDQTLNEYYEQHQIIPAPAADDAEFLRRVSLDLIGQTPEPNQVREFLKQTDSDKREHLIKALLRDRRHADHFAKTWRFLLLPEAETDTQMRYFQPGLEAWLEGRRLENAGFDAIVQGLLTVPIATPEERPQLVLRDLKAPNPLAFIASKGNDPAVLAASSTRLFLGIRLECAQCHDHPFDSWTQTQFWNQAAFFAGIERKGSSPFSPLVENRSQREIAMMGTDKLAPVLFLSGGQPELNPESSSRSAFADWITSPENSLFARAIVNRIWGQLMGEGLVDPVDDFTEANPPSHPELLDFLAEAFTDSGYDLNLLYTAICGTEAYQRTSRLTHESQNEPHCFAKMAIKPLSGEQFFATLAQTIRYQNNKNSLEVGRNEDPVRRRVLGQFASTGLYSNPETSVSQALALMNGSLVNRSVSPESSATIQQLMKEQSSLNQQIEELYLLAYSRFPTESELAQMSSYVASIESSHKSQRLGDILWVMLNSAEFRWNH